MPRKAENHIRVTEKTWKELNQLKGPGDSFDDVIQRLLEEDEADEGNGIPTTTPTQTAD